MLAVYSLNDSIVNHEQADLLRDEYRSLQVLKLHRSIISRSWISRTCLIAC